MKARRFRPPRASTHNRTCAPGRREMNLFCEETHVVKGLDPVADAFSGTVYSDVVSMKENNRCVFLVVKGVGTTGTSTITVQACDDFVPTTRTAIPFRYRRLCNTGDVEGAITQA